MDILASCRISSPNDGSHDLHARCLSAADEIERLHHRLFRLGAMHDSPCFCCGYNGVGYYQPDTHPCAALHHKLAHEA